VVRARETQGPFTVTIFSPAESSTSVATDVTVMVQRSDSDEVLLDASVDLGFSPPAGASIRADELLCGQSGTTLVPRAQPIAATCAQAANKLLYGASIVLPIAGDWQLRASVRRGDDAADFTCTLPVRASSSRLAILWPYLAIPPIAIALFALNQLLGRRATLGGGWQLTDEQLSAKPTTAPADQ